MGRQRRRGHSEWFQRDDIASSNQRRSCRCGLVAAEHTYHPIKDYLTSLDHDGGERVEGFAANMLGAEPTATTRW